MTPEGQVDFMPRTHAETAAHAPVPAHAHAHARAAVAASARPTLLRLSAWERLAGAAALSVLIWIGVWWALH